MLSKGGKNEELSPSIYLCSHLFHLGLVILQQTNDFRISYLYFYWPREVAHIDEESDIWVVAEVKFLVRKAILVLFDLAL